MAKIVKPGAIARELHCTTFVDEALLDFVAVTSEWQSASDEDWALAPAREAVIRPLADQPELTEGFVATASAELGISRNLAYRLVAKSRKRRQVSSLLPGKRGRRAHYTKRKKCRARHFSHLLSEAQAVQTMENLVKLKAIVNSMRPLDSNGRVLRHWRYVYFFNRLHRSVG